MAQKRERRNRAQGPGKFTDMHPAAGDFISTADPGGETDGDLRSEGVRCVRAEDYLRRLAGSGLSGGGGEKPEATEEATRCSGSECRKRVGLMGFRCRCGDVFCSEHRYSDRHDCSYDYKAAGREAIAKENPVVRAAKLVKV